MVGSSSIQDSVYFTQIQLPFVVLFFEIILHLVVSRYWIKKGTIISTMVAYSSCLIILFGLQYSVQQEQHLSQLDLIGLSALNFVFYSAMAFFYFSFVNIGESSVRIRILRELADSKDGGISKENLLEKYNVNHIIQSRIERMISSGEMVLRNDRYYYSGKPKMLLIAKTCQRIKKLLLGKKSFEASKST